MTSEKRQQMIKAAKAIHNAIRAADLAARRANKAIKAADRAAARVDARIANLLNIAR